MAKKRKKDKKQEEEEYEFKPPEFNEREFLEKEIRDTRAAIASVGVAIIFGVVAGVITALASWLVALAFIAGLCGILMLKSVYSMIGADVSAWTLKNWVGTIATYFFTFLAIWVLTINTPFADLTDPSIQDITVWVSDGFNITGVEYKESETSGALTWIRMDNNATPEGLIKRDSSCTINITAKIADSGGISFAEIALNSSTSEYYLMTKESTGKYHFSFDGTWLEGQTRMSFFIHAKDKHGNENIYSPGSPFPI